MSGTWYDGPIIDAHTHLWNLTENDHYPWLRPAGNFGPKGRLDALKGKNYVLDDYRRDIAGTGVVASVHIEALWETAADPVNETRWLESLGSPDLASRYVAAATFGVAGTRAELEAQAAFDRVRGIRQVIAWTPNPERRMAAEADITRRPEWREAITTLLDLDLHLELLMYPHQAQNVAELAADFPTLPIVVNHIGSPIEQDDAGLELWRDGVTLMSAQSNVLVKLSAAAAYPTEKSVDAMRPFADHLVGSFGADRVMVGSDFPVGTLVGWSYATYMDAYRAVLEGNSRDEQAAMFHDTAARLYRMAV
ncbi:putative TIM-barrel fold metal-dependent hydrolase [Conyzicola lurida]|uniref:Putative TIM-barrel fold metal-dependent hydrolase n=1 Tax=Conyzicola lurida TaxID=1172621 RepID=A0A841AHY9_9MICO|nr:amidohydrolase family protein [Conyzicola lurida]MBB5841958.1 putative TIM-barrel fold metal-dependent hydrolase [Conyzicola lurida]